ncbi:MAG TPA: hypothetical protein VFA45_15140 [Actinomycetes bacterium]|jgi:hypothetical protein|nr:hypothetical protein [Actinomycetes bacterium]
MNGRELFRQTCYQLDGGADPNLREYFKATDVIRALGALDGPRVLAVGIKGIGKSAAFRYFDDFNRDADVVVALDPERYSLHLPNKDLGWAAYRDQFEYDLVLEALRAIKEQSDRLRTKVTKALLDKAAKHVSTYNVRLKAASRRFGGVSILGFGFTLNDPELPVLIGLEGDTKLKQARDTLAQLCEAGVTVRIVVDDPEQVFSASKELDTNLVGGFCLAALRLSAQISNLKVVPLLTSHVYHPLVRRIDDLSKYPDHTGRLSWRQEELVDLVDRRLKWAKLKWTDIFESSESQARKVVDAMLGEVRNGPRDLLRWLYHALEGGGKISKHHIDRSRTKMAADARRELEASYLSEYEDVTILLRMVFGKNPRQSYTLAELRSHVANLQISDDGMQSLYKRLPWMQRETFRTLPRVFLRVGALVLESGGSLILPYEEGYDEERLETTETVRLVPAIAMGIG